MTLDPRNPMTRRRVLSGVVVAGAAAPILAACGTGEDPESAPTTSSDPTTPASEDPTSEAPAPSDSASETPADSGGTNAEVVAKSADVPVGSGFINKDAHVVVTQPTAGEYKGFTSVCTHRQCDVSNFVGGKIRCGCHESMYSIEDGSVQGGPAPAPLAAIAVKVDGANIVKA